MYRHVPASTASDIQNTQFIRYAANTVAMNDTPKTADNVTILIIQSVNG